MDAQFGKLVAKFKVGESVNGGVIVQKRRKEYLVRTVVKNGSDKGRLKWLPERKLTKTDR